MFIAVKNGWKSLQHRTLQNRPATRRVGPNTSNRGVRRVTRLSKLTVNELHKLENSDSAYVKVAYNFRPVSAEIFRTVLTNALNVSAVNDVTKYVFKLVYL